MSIKMDYTFNVQRGWPQDGAAYSNETITAGQTLNAGDVVELQADGTVNVCGVAAATLIHVGFVVRGNGDSDSVAAAGDIAVVLWSGFIARTTAAVIAGLNPGDPLMADAGVLKAVVTTEAPIAQVMKVHPADSVNAVDSLTILVR